ncbi:SET domain-containing protein 5 [Pyricularia oryzae]
MKAVQVLSFYFVAVLAARDSIQNHLALGICRSPLLPLSFPELTDPICSTADVIAQRQATGGRHITDESSPWTSISNCARNGTGPTEFCVFYAGGFANNRGVSIITSPARAKSIAKLPAFTNPELTAHTNKDLDPNYTPVYKSVMVPGKGVGLVAARTLYRGDRIMSSTPAIVIDYGFFETMPKKIVREIQTAAVDILPENHRQLLLNLSSHDGLYENYQQKVDKILSTNAFDIDADPEGDNDDQFYVVFPEISRCNHDCRPNADYYYDPETLTQHVHAVRQINIGEEISLSYLDPLQSQAARLARLSRTWGFPCGCSMCTQRDLIAEESDSRLEQIAELRKEFHDYTPSSRATPQMAELMVSLYQQERLDLMLYEAFTYAAIEYNGVGEPWLATKYARLAVEYGLASVGPKDNDVIEMDNLVLDPFKHWSWMLRTSKRMSWGKKRDD